MIDSFASVESAFDEIAERVSKVQRGNRVYIEALKSLDGISAASILYKTFLELGAKVFVRFSVGGQKQEQAPSSDFKVSIGVDAQGADLSIGGEEGIKPSAFGYDDLSGGSLSVIAQLIREKVSSTPEETYPAALLGALSSFQDQGAKRTLEGLNQAVLEKAKAKKVLSEEERLELPFGDILPLKDSLSLSYDPYFKGITGNPSVAETVIASTGIELVREGRYVTLKDLKPDESEAVERVLSRYSTVKELKRRSIVRLGVDESSFNYNLRDTLYVLEPLIVKNEAGRAFKALLEPESAINSELFYESIEETAKIVSAFNNIVNSRERFVDEGATRRVVGTGLVTPNQMIFIYKWVFRWDDSKNKIILAETNDGPEEVFITVEKPPMDFKNLSALSSKYSGKIFRYGPFIIIYVNVIKAGLLYEDMRKLIAGVP